MRDCDTVSAWQCQGSTRPRCDFLVVGFVVKVDKPARVGRIFYFFAQLHKIGVWLYKVSVHPYSGGWGEFLYLRSLVDHMHIGVLDR